MKSFRILILLLSISFTTFGQSVSNDYANQINAAFAGINLNTVPHGLLKDYAMEFAELNDYDGNLTKENILQRGSYVAVYNTLLMARTKTNVPDLVNPEHFEAQWEKYRHPHHTAISGVFYKYSQLRNNAAIRAENNVLYDTSPNGRALPNPYDTKEVFAMAAPVMIYKNLTLTVKLPRSMFFTNQLDNIKGLFVDFRDGEGYQYMSWEDEIKVSYERGGVYEWRYKLHTMEGEIFQSHSRILIDVPTQNIAIRTERGINEPCQTDPDTVEFFGTQRFQNRAGIADIEIEYATTACQITRPLIVAEGFDAGLLGGENPFGESSYRDFEENFEDIRRLEIQIRNYDIIYVNFRNGKDFIQRNALLLEDIIQWVNQVKEPNAEQNVVLGQSMGGLIARYALADMEQRHIDHDTRLYISHDSPHQGANIPLGITALARHAVDKFVKTPIDDININPNDNGNVSIKSLKDLIESPAARQMMRNYIDDNFQIDNSQHRNWQLELIAKRYPTRTRNIAISNGSMCGNGQDFNPSDILFNLEGEGRTTAITDFGIIGLQYLSGSWFGLIGGIGTSVGVSGVTSILFNEPSLLLGMIPGGNKFKLNFRCRAVPTSGTIDVYKGKLTYTKSILWLVNINSNIMDRTFQNPNGELPMDSYAGGLSPSFITAINMNSNNAHWLTQLLLSYDIEGFAEPRFNFIPVPSALDVGRNLTPLVAADYARSYGMGNAPTGTRRIPFDNFIAGFANQASENEVHISFNQINGDWLATELQPNNIPPLFDCTDFCRNEIEILGENEICEGDDYVYSLSTNNGTINWSVIEGNGLVNLSTNGRDAVLAPNRFANGRVVLQAVLRDSVCLGEFGSLRFTKTIWVGTPILDMNIECEYSVPTANCYTMCKNYNFAINDFVSINVLGGLQPLTLDWEWEQLTRNFRLLADDNRAFLQASQTGFISMRVRAKNRCGFSNWLPIQIYVEDCGRGRNNFEVYPNPTTYNLNIRPLPTSNLPSSDSPTEVKLYDMLGQLKKEITLDREMNGTILVNDLKNGLYILKVYYNEQLETHQIQIGN